jgi:hypothetical protein
VLRPCRLARCWSLDLMSSSRLRTEQLSHNAPPNLIS